MGAPGSAGSAWERLERVEAPGSAWERLGPPESTWERLGTPGSAWERLERLGPHDQEIICFAMDGEGLHGWFACWLSLHCIVFFLQRILDVSVMLEPEMRASVVDSPSSLAALGAQIDPSGGFPIVTGGAGGPDTAPVVDPP